MITLSVGPEQEEAVSNFQDGNRLWVAALAGAPHAMATDRGRGAEAGAGRAVALTGRYSFDSGNWNPIGWSEKQVGQAAENAMGFNGALPSPTCLNALIDFDYYSPPLAPTLPPTLCPGRAGSGRQGAREPRNGSGRLP
jgi:hypothetical protein